MPDRTVPTTDARAVAPEFALAVACCRWPPLPPDALARAAGEVRDWSRFVMLIARHRVTGAVADAIERRGLDLPAEARAALTAAARHSTARAMANAAAELRVDRALRADGIRPLFVKGASLSASLYGSVAFKTSWDIDVAVTPAEVQAAGVALRRLGYRPVAMGAAVDARALDRHVATAREVAWHDPRDGTVVELHRVLVDDRAAFSCDVASVARQPVALAPGCVVETLRDEELFAYLSVHGMSHGWARLKWLADLAALVVRHGDAATLYSRAADLGAGRAAAVALVLAATIFDVALPPALAARLRHDRAVDRLAARARTLLDVGDARPGHYLPTLRESLVLIGIQAAIVPGAAYTARYAARLLVAPRWRFQLALPAWLRVPALLVAAPWRAARWRHRAGIARSSHPPAAS